MGSQRDRLAVLAVLGAVALASVASLSWLLMSGARAPESASAKDDALKTAPGAAERLTADVVRVDSDRVVLRTESETLALELEVPLVDTLTEGESVEVEGRAIGRSRFGSRYLRGRLRPTRPVKRSAPSAAKSDAPPWSRSRLKEALQKVRR